MPGKIIARTRERQKAAHEHAEKEYREACKKEYIAQLQEEARLRAQQATCAEVNYDRGMDISQQAVIDQKKRAETWTARAERYIAKLTSPV